MAAALIFAAHIIFLGYIVTQKWRKDSHSSALTNAALIIILFSVGWSIITMVLRLFVEPQGFGKHFDRDAIALTLLTIGEYFFYKYYYFPAKEITEDGKEK